MSGNIRHVSGNSMLDGNIQMSSDNR